MTRGPGAGRFPIQIFGDEALRDRFEGLVLDLVMRGHTVAAAERKAARELMRQGETNGD